MSPKLEVALPLRGETGVGSVGIGKIDEQAIAEIGTRRSTSRREETASTVGCVKLTTRAWRWSTLGGEFGRKAGPLGQAFPRFSLQLPSRLRAISVTSKNRERGKSRAIPTNKKIAALLKSHKTGPPDQHLALRRKCYRRQLLLFNAVAKRLFRSQLEVICHLA